MKKTILSLLFISCFANSEALIFNGVDDYSNNNSLLGVKIIRGANVQKEYERLQAEKPKVQENQNTIINQPTGSYQLSNVPEINSFLSLNKNGEFFWSMKYEDTYLNTMGKWEYSKNNQTYILNTDPKPKNIMFKYLKSEKAPQYIETQRLGGGDLIINVNYRSLNELDVSGGIEGIEVTCEGMYGIVKTETSKEGRADCIRVGYPIKKLTLKAKDIPNDTFWISPKFEGTNWIFNFDLISAKNEYFFENEKFQLNGQDLIWNARSLGANQQWIYKK